MATLPKLPERSPGWSAEAMAMAAQAKVLSGAKTRAARSPPAASQRAAEGSLLALHHPVRYQGHQDHRRWTEIEFEIVREELVKRSLEEVAKKINRTPKAIRNMLKRNHLSLREIRCDLFSVESLATALRVRKAEIIFWIEHGWLQATIVSRGKRRSYTITPEALMNLYKQHHADVLKRGIPNQALFEAYVQYCFAPKHTVGEQLLDVRRDKRERAAYVAAVGVETSEDKEEKGNEGDKGDDRRYGAAMRLSGFLAEETECQDE
jgi:hypothetical protein